MQSSGEVPSFGHKASPPALKRLILFRQLAAWQVGFESWTCFTRGECHCLWAFVTHSHLFVQNQAMHCEDQFLGALTPQSSLLRGSGVSRFS